MPTRDDPDARILEFAARQRGLVTRGQLLAAGVREHRIEYRLRRGRLRRLHQGVYRVGPIAAALEREMAAVLACGSAAVVSHASAAAVWGLVPPRPAGTPVEISLPQGCRRPSGDVCVHRVPGLQDDERTRLDGLPITTPARTLLDLAGSFGEIELERALARAWRRELVESSAIEALLARHARRHGAGRLRTLVARAAEPTLTRSAAEDRFLDLVRRARLRCPEVNVKFRGYEIDCLWRAERVAVEIDGFAFHSSRLAFERDRRRDAVLAAAGIRVLRVTWRQISREPEAVVVVLAQALATPAGTSRLRR